MIDDDAYMKLRAEFYSDFIEAQGKFPIIEQEGSNPHFNSKFADWRGIIRAVRDILYAHNIGFMQFVSRDENGRPILITHLIHRNGYIETVDGMVLNPTKQDPQALGSAITYAKRYSLLAALGIATGEPDDDGNAASEASTDLKSTAITITTPRTSPLGQAPLPVSDSGGSGSGVVTQPMVNKLRRILASGGLTKAGDDLAYATKILEREHAVENLKTDLTYTEFEQVLAAAANGVVPE